ncbi:hypothetical protein [Rhizobium ruizarguesonis]|uniref:hypothetical protein n=1 Tax=Rhizobium ruizarguesonis TaxID=2081791 RepID=UPI001FEF4F76|nr:hypothetical protein [Rhizobium ruizarguesonis]
MRDHRHGNPVENLHRVEGGGNAVQHAFLEFVAGNRLAVAAAGAVEFLDRQALLAIGAAITVLAGDRVRPTALGAFQHPAQKIFGALRGVETIGRASFV